MQKRISHEKSRNGCITCKLRHTKCGEERPTCLKCIKSGWKCEGYSNESQNQLRARAAGFNTTVNPDRFLVLHPGSKQERHHVHIFCTETSGALSGYFVSELWNRFLPQLSQIDSTVSHAVAAVGAAYVFRTKQSADRFECEAFSLKHYNKALQQFRQQLINHQDIELDILLVACLLFACFEMLRSNNARILDHIQGGMQILHIQQQKKLKPRIGDDLNHELSQIFYRLSLQLPLFGRHVVPFNPQSEKSTAQWCKRGLPFGDISQARYCLTDLMSQCLTLTRSVGFERVAPSAQIYEQLVQQQSQLHDMFSNWYSAFASMMQKPAKRTGIVDHRAPLVLQVNFYASLIWLLSFTSRSECRYDEHNTYFKYLVKAAEEVILGPRKEWPVSQLSFSLDPEIAPVVYWTAIKCREPQIRRRAIEVLSNYPTKDRLWGQGNRYCMVARRILEIEESSLSLPVEMRVPLDSQRIYEVLMSPSDDLDQNPYPVPIMMKPQGVDGPWETHTEYVAW